MHCLKGFGICWIIVIFLPYIWPMPRMTDWTFVNLKKQPMTSKSGTIGYSPAIEILQNEIKKIQTTLEKITEKFDELEARFSHQKIDKEIDKNFHDEERYFSSETLSNNATIHLNTTENLRNNANVEIFRNKLERISRIQERNSRLLAILMSSLTNLEDSLDRLENLFNSTGSIVENKDENSSLTIYQQNVVNWLNSIDKKLYEISSARLEPVIPITSTIRIDYDNYDNNKKNHSSVNEDAFEIDENGESTMKNVYAQNGAIESCESLRNNGNYVSGVYTLDKRDIAMRTIWGNVSMINCDVGTNGGGWTIVQRRGGTYGGRVDFNRSWNDYANGFGDFDGEFWLGNEVVHRMTFYHGQYELRIDLEDWDGETVWAQYSNFELGTRMDGYRIKIGGYTGNATDSLSAHYSTPFSTYDRRNDFSPQCCPCTTDYGGGWWYYSCFEANLNGNYYRMNEYREPYRGIIWEHWRDDYSLKSTKMMIRSKYRNTSNRTW